MLPGPDRHSQGRPPRADACGFILPRPASSSEFLRSSSRPSFAGALPDSGFQALFAADRERPLPARASDPRYVPSPGFLIPSTVFSAFGVAGLLFRPPRPGFFFARPGRRSLGRWTPSIGCIRRATLAPRRAAGQISPNCSGRSGRAGSLGRARTGARPREGLAWDRGLLRTGCVRSPASQGSHPH